MTRATRWARRAGRTTLLAVALSAVPFMAAPIGVATSAVGKDVGAFGDVGFYGSTDSVALNAPLVGMAPTPTGHGYWLIARDGGLFTFGDARFSGSTGNLKLTQPVVGMAATPSGHGYWVVASDGGVFAFGDARFYGSTGALTLRRPIVGIASTPSGHGYWMVASDGGIFAFGDARFFGSTGNLKLTQPVVGMAATPSGHGYWMVASDGGVFAFGDARFFGSTGGLRLAQPVVGMAAPSAGGGYWMVARDGGVFAFGAARFSGSNGSALLAGEHVVGIARGPSDRGYWTVATVADTGGYPDSALPCEHAPYSSHGYCTTVNGPYDWGPVRDTTPGWSVATSHSPRGYSYRNCTDWVAWRLEQSGVPDAMVRGLGNGGQWAANATGRAGLTVSATPRRGDAAVQIGNPGHVAYVEAVYADGAIRVSEYNKWLDGTYDSRTGTPAQLGFQAFIDFS
jgi:surface antigen/ribosomal protein L24E